MPKLENITHKLGSAIKISTILSIDTATSCLITIEDPAGTDIVEDIAMTKEMNKIYSYVYQSSSTGTSGDYTVTIEASSGGYTSVKQDIFTMEKQD